MNTLIVAVVASLAALAVAAPSGHGTVVAGPSGVVTGHGAIGPVGHGAIGPVGHGLGLGYGLGLGHGAVLAAPVAHTVVSGPAHLGLGYAGHGLGLGYAGHGLGLGYAGHGLGLGYAGHGIVGVGHHGVAVKGPETVPAVISGPSGKIVADGLYGVPHHGVHGW